VAQEEVRQEGFTGEVEVSEVLLDVLVQDRKGNVILGLDEKDFQVTEAGKPVEITDVVFYSNRRLLDAPGAKRPEVSAGTEDRFFILFFDDQRSAAMEAPQLLRQQLEAARRAREWVAKEMVPGDHVAVVSYDQKLKVHQDFTADRRALEGAISAAARGKDTDGNWPSRIPGGEGPSLLGGLPRGNELRDRTTTIYEGLQELARSAGNVRGRKNLLYFGIGFGRINEFGQYTPDPRYYDDTVQAMNDNNIAFYAIDLTPPGTEHVLSDALNQVASETGGKYFFNTVSFLTPLRQVSEETSGYYLISYRATHPAGERGFQEVEVKTNNPEFRIKAREGYVFGG
jgi:VWFA-related protein